MEDYPKRVKNVHVLISVCIQCDDEKWEKGGKASKKTNHGAVIVHQMTPLALSIGRSHAITLV